MPNVSKMISGVIVIVVAIGLAACGGAQERKERYMQKAEQHIEEKNFDKAMVDLKNVLQIDPKHVEAHFRLGELQEKNGKLREAFGSYRRASELDPEHVQAQYRLGRFYVIGGDLEAAGKVHEKLQALQPDGAEARLVLAGIMSREGDKNEALEITMDVFDRNPANTDAAGFAAALLDRMEQSERAVSLLQRAVEANPEEVNLRLMLARLYAKSGDVDRGERALKELVALESGSYESRMRLAQFYVENDRLDQAEQLLRELILDDPDEAKRYIALARFLAAERTREAAVRELEEAVDKKPDLAELRLGLGSLYEVEEDQEKAAALYQALIDRYGTEPYGLRARNELADLRFKEGKNREAEALVNEVLEESPQDTAALLVHGRIALAEGRAREAANDFRRLLRDFSQSVEVRQLLATALLADGQVELAADELRHAIDMNPGDPKARVFYAEFLARTRRFDQSLEELEGALKLNPQDLQALQMKTAVAEALDQPETAEQAVGKLLELSPEDPTVYLIAGQLYGRKGEYERADEAFSGAWEKLPREAKARPYSELGFQILQAWTGAEARGGRADSAADRLTRIAEQWPRNSYVRAILGELHWSQGRADDAIGDMRRAIESRPEWPRPYLSLATYLSQRKDWNGVIATLNAAPEAFREHPAIQFSLARALDKAGRGEEADGIFSRLESLDNTNADARSVQTLLAQYFLGNGDRARALRLSESIRRSAPDDVTALRISSRAAVLMGNAEVARTAADKLLALDPDSADAHLLSAQAYLLQQQNDKAEEALNAVVSLNPDNARAYLALARLRIQDGDQDKGEEYVRKALDKAPRDPLVLRAAAELAALKKDPDALESALKRLQEVSPDATFSYYPLGQLYLSQKKFKEAAVELEKAVATLNRGDPIESIAEPYQVVKTLARAYVSNGEPKTALDRLAKLAEDKDLAAVAQQVAGEVLVSEGKGEEASEHFQQARALDPDWAVPYLSLAALANRAGGAVEEIEVYREGLERMPGNRNLLLALAAAYEGNGDHAGAIATYRKVLAQEPENVLVKNNLAVILADHASGPEDLTDAKELAADFENAQQPILKDTLGWVYYRLGDYDRAVALLKDVVEKAPKVNVFHYHLGMAYYRQGDANLALAHLRRAVSGDAAYAGREEAEQTLKEIESRNQSAVTGKAAAA